MESPERPLFERELCDWPTHSLLSFRSDLVLALEETRARKDRPARNAALRLIGRVEAELATRDL